MSVRTEPDLEKDLKERIGDQRTPGLDGGKFSTVWTQIGSRKGSLGLGATRLRLLFGNLVAVKSTRWKTVKVGNLTPKKNHKKQSTEKTEQI